MVQYDHDHARRCIQQDYLGPSPIFNHCKFQQIFHITQGAYDCMKGKQNTMISTMLVTMMSLIVRHLRPIPYMGIKSKF